MGKNITVLVLLFIGIHFGLKAQCKYDYQEKDGRTGKTTFKTKEFILSNGESKNQTYIVKEITAQF